MKTYFKLYDCIVTSNYLFASLPNIYLRMSYTGKTTGNIFTRLKNHTESENINTMNNFRVNC